MKAILLLLFIAVYSIAVPTALSSSSVKSGESILTPGIVSKLDMLRFSEEMNRYSGTETVLLSTHEATKPSTGKLDVYEAHDENVFTTGLPGSLNALVKTADDLPEIVSPMNNGAFIVEDAVSGTTVCNDLILKNTQTTPVIITQISLPAHSEFSVSNNTFPLLIEPHQQVSIRVCVTPSSAKEQHDTCILQSGASSLVVPLYSRTISPIAYESRFDGQSVTTVISDNYRVSIAEPYPNPSTSLIALPIQKYIESGKIVPDEQCSIYTMSGQLIAQAIYTKTYSKKKGTSDYEVGEWSIHVENLADGLYLAVLHTADEILTFQIKVGH